MFLIYCISGFLIAEIIIRLIKISLLDVNLPFLRKVRYYLIAVFGGLPDDHVHHIFRTGQYTMLIVFQKQLELLAKKSDPDFRRLAHKFIDENLKHINDDPECLGGVEFFVNEKEEQSNE